MLQFGASTAAQERPKLAILVAEIIAIAAEIDTLLGDTLTAMLGADAKPALAMYSELRAAHIQNAALMAAAREVLDDESLLMMETVLQFATRTMADRNKLAHWHWGISYHHPDALLLMKPDGKRAIDRTMEQLKKGSRSIVADEVVDLGFDFKQILVYRERDLKDVIARLGVARRSVARLHNLVDPISQSQQSRSEIWEALLSEPELAEALRLSQKKKNRT